MDEKIIQLAKSVAVIEPACLLAFIEVETGGRGFDPSTGKIMIQFEPVWFRRQAPYAPSGKWSYNKVEVQKKEWEAFSDAFSKDPDAAMKSASIGLGQIMGFHWERLGYNSVGEMWDEAKQGLSQQFDQIVRFIITDSKLMRALKSKDWDSVARIYNGEGYKEMAKKIPREPYDISLAKAYQKYLKV